jgi:hypothetical protein
MGSPQLLKLLWPMRGRWMSPKCLGAEMCGQPLANRQVKAAILSPTTVKQWSINKGSARPVRSDVPSIFTVTNCLAIALNSTLHLQRDINREDFSVGPVFDRGNAVNLPPHVFDHGVTGKAGD